MHYGDGKIDIAPNIGRVTFNAFGNIKHYIIPDSTDLDLVCLDFLFSDDAIKLMNQSLAKYTTLAAVNLSGVTFTKAVTEIMGVKEADKIISDISMNGELRKIPDELQHTMLLSNIEMSWDKEHKWFVSQGPIGIVAFSKNQINKFVKGYITVQKTRGGDEVNIYLEFDQNDWYYFNYKSNLLQAVSSNAEFNKAITDTKPDKRQLKSEKGKPAFSYYIAGKSKKDAFLKKVEPSGQN